MLQNMLNLQTQVIIKSFHLIVLILQLALPRKRYIPFEYTLKEFFDYWLYYYMIDERKISYNTFCSYRNVIYNYFLKIWDPNRKITDIERNDIQKVLDSIEKKSVLRLSYTVLKSAFAYAKNHQMYQIFRETGTSV